MSTSKLSETLKTQQSDILKEWTKELTIASSSRTDLISESELRTDAEQFLAALTIAVSTGSLDIQDGSCKPVLEILSTLSRTRGRKGFSPSETAGFVFSFKQALLSGLRKTHQGDAAGFADDTWTAFSLIDKLGLYTTEVYQQAREEVIRRQQEEMLELSTPVVQLWDGIVALPLIGTLDSARTSVVMETLLQTIVETRSEIAIIDITGVPTVDTLVAQHLLEDAWRRRG